MGVTCNPGGFAGGAGAENVQKEEKSDTIDLLSYFHSTLQGLGNGAGAIPHGDAVGQDALSGASLEGGHDGCQVV